MDLLNQDSVTDIQIEKTLQKSYLDYSMSVIVGRALPDVRDGLKPVHRRILYSMKDLNLTAKSPFKKCARITGTVLGQYHPHGDNAVYEALVRMAQNFSLRMPLVDGQGNFGSIDGDNAAAQRYCVTGNTKVNTENGLQNISDLVPNSELNSDNAFSGKVISFEKKIHSTSKFFNSGKHKIFQVISKDGFKIEGSGNHPILTFTTDENGKPTYQWKRLDKIDGSEKIVIDRSETNLDTRNSSKQDLDFANFTASQIIQGQQTFIPKDIFSLPKEAQQVFLKKIFQANFSYSTNKQTAQDIQLLLLQFGLIGILSIGKNADEVTIEILDNRSRIAPNSLKSYINSNLVESSPELSIIKKQKEFVEFYMNNYYYTDIQSFGETEREETVYSIKVDSECHSFVANGFINHNTEARLTHYAVETLKDIEKNTVDFVPNYDDSLEEPSVLPSRVPNLLINGSNGIAVGMATNIPPHRLDEIIDATIKLLENPKTEIEELLEIVKGPDFPTGGIIFGKQGIVEAYKTGRGRIKVRAKIHHEKVGTREAIIIDEIPYQVNKSRLIEQVATLVKTKAIEGISDIRDESDRTGIRVVIELKKGVIREIIENNLFKATSLETTFGIIMLAIKNREPKIFNILEALQEFISHRKSVVIRRTLFDLQKAETKAHLLDGFYKAFHNINDVVKLIRASKNGDEAKSGLQEKFSFTPQQTTAILDMRLQKLTSLEKDKLVEELAELKKLIAHLSTILKNEETLRNLIKEELVETKAQFTSPRRTEIVDNYDNIEDEDLIPNIPMVVTITNSGYIKRVPLTLYEKQSRGGKGKIAVTTHDDDFTRDFFTSNAHDTLLIITNFGQLFWLKVYKIPESSRQAKGKAIVNLISLREGEEIRAILPTNDFSDKKSLTFFTKKGIVKRTKLTEFSNIRNNGVKAILLDEFDELVTAQIIDEHSKYISIFTSFAQAIRFEIGKVRDQGRNTRGVRGIKFKKDDDVVVGGIIINDDSQEILIISENGLGKRSSASEYRLTNRAGSGVISMKLSNRTGKRVISSLVVEDDKDLMILTESGKMIRLSFDDVNTTGRNTSGVTLIRGDKVLSISKSPKSVIEEISDEVNQVSTILDN